MDDLLDLFGAVANGFQERLHGLPALEALGLAPYQGRMLALVGRHPGCSQQELARWTGRDKAQVARALKVLEQRRLVGRVDHRTDWRAYSLDLLPAGREAFELLSRQRAEVGRDLLSDMSRAEQDAMRHILVRMKGKLSAGTGAAPVRDAGPPHRSA